MTTTPYIVALTGGIGSGKTEASKLFAKLGVPIVDLDMIAHALTRKGNPLLKKVASIFGSAYLTDDGELDRKKLREHVFNHDDAREKLNALLHPAIHAEAIAQLEAIHDTPYVILAIPLLTEDSPYKPAIDRILTIDCDEETQIARVQKRSKLSRDVIKKIIGTQVSRQTRLDMADDVLENSGNVEDLGKKIFNLHEKYIKTCIVSKTIS